MRQQGSKVQQKEERLWLMDKAAGLWVGTSDVDVRSCTFAALVLAVDFRLGGFQAARA